MLAFPVMHLCSCVYNLLTLLFTLGVDTRSLLSHFMKCLSLLRPHSSRHPINLLSFSVKLSEGIVYTNPSQSLSSADGCLKKSVWSNICEEINDPASFWLVTINMRVLRALEILAGMKTIRFYLKSMFPKFIWPYKPLFSFILLKIIEHSKDLEWCTGK